MKPQIFLLFLGIFITTLTFGQDQEKYAQLIGEAWKLYESKAFPQSGQKYAEAFVALGNKGMVNDRYKWKLHEL